eukprot:6400655-Pyramimonas_sp.AAC.1
MKEIFLRPLLVHMGISEDYERPDDAGNQKIDVVGTDTPLGQHYRRGIVEYFGTSNVAQFLLHVENTVQSLQEEDIDKAFSAGVVTFVESVQEAQRHAPVVDAG